MMAADYNKPVNTDNYADILEQLRDNIQAAQTLLNDLTGVTNIPTGAIRYDQTLNKFESYDGSTFNDLVLSPSGGGTGITNWAKASTAEAEAGTADKYPDAAGVLASIEANSFDGSNAELIWSGSSTSVDLDSLPGGYPGDGIYIVAREGGDYSSIYSRDSVRCYAGARHSRRGLNNDLLGMITLIKGSDNSLSFFITEFDGDGVNDPQFPLSRNIIEVYKVS